ncbi:hypothetical protein [Thioclava atlantica]|uniref:Phosphoadenosine phosphosulfate reductase n=1 Tax=Thioclava atlantica TaxID=1317124 RepID=A0A085U096_9RHOB|nr:hypothetical protein [Thioclava atlantica]KFE36393.1 hypothetical protein DW2_03754 [Thioclava atlantica]
MARHGDIGWKEQLGEIAEENGYYEPLGASHEVLFNDDGPVLLVTFENSGAIEAERADALPRGYRIANEHGWSSLTLICNSDTWYRDPAVYAYFDRLVDEAFFEDFDRVVFYGAGPCGYAAAAFSVTAPGATVIALQPQATLDPALTVWDDRFAHMRRISFTDRYGYAPEMLDGVGQAFVFYDPFERHDAMHAALFARPCVTLMPCRNLGRSVEWMLREMDILDEILIAACKNEFEPAQFWPLFRARRNLPRYARNMAGRLQAAGRPYLEALVCRNIAERLNGPRFRARFETLEQVLAERRITLPASKNRSAPD